MAMRPKRLFLYVAPLVGLVALAAYVIGLGRRQQLWSRLPSGTEVRLAAVTYGTNQEFIVGWPWQKALHRILPGPLKSRSGCRVVNFPKDSGPTFLLQARDIARDGSGPDGTLRIRYIDRYGCELTDNGSSMMSFSGETEALRYTALQRDIYGAHGEIAGLALREKPGLEESDRSVELFVPGITLTPPKQTISELAVQQADGLQFHLKTFLTGLEAAPPAYNGRSWTKQFSQVEFLVTRNDGSVCSDWAVEMIRFLGADGARIPEGYQSARRGPAPVLNFDGLLKVGEKVSFEVKFTQKQHFAPDQIVRFPKVKIPVREVHSTDISVVSRDITLRVIEVGGADPNRAGESEIPTSAYLCVAATPAPRGLNVWPVQTDEDHDSLPVVISPAKGGKFYIGLPSANQPREVTLTLAVHLSQWLKFEAAPEHF